MLCVCVCTRIDLSWMKSNESVSPSLRERKGKTEPVRVRCEEERHAKNMGWIKRNTPSALGFVATYFDEKKRYSIHHHSPHVKWVLMMILYFSPLFNFQFEIDTFSYSMCNGFIFGALIVYVILNGTGDILKRTVCSLHSLAFTKPLSRQNKEMVHMNLYFPFWKKLPLSLAFICTKSTHSPQ